MAPFLFLSQIFPIKPYTPIHSGISKRSFLEKRVSNSQNLNIDATSDGERTHKRAAWKRRFSCGLDAILPLILRSLYMAGNISFQILQRKVFWTATFTYLFISISLIYTLTIILLHSSVFVLEPDISHYTLYSFHSGISKRRLLEKRVSNSLNLNIVATSEGERTHNRAVWKRRFSCGLDTILPLILRSLYMAGNISFQIVQRKVFWTANFRYLFTSLIEYTPWQSFCHIAPLLF